MDSKDVEIIKRIRAERNCSLKEAISIHKHDKILERIKGIQTIEDIKSVLETIVLRGY